MAHTRGAVSTAAGCRRNRGGKTHSEHTGTAKQGKLEDLRNETNPFWLWNYLQSYLEVDFSFVSQVYWRFYHT